MKEREVQVIAHLDLDCFYAQVEQRRLNISPDLPLAVYQWNGIIAVNYAARKYVHVGVIGASGSFDTEGVTPNRTQHKACLKRYRDASREVLDIIYECHHPNFERTSIDEVYIDLTADVDLMLEKLACALTPLQHVYDKKKMTTTSIFHDVNICDTWCPPWIGTVSQEGHDDAHCGNEVYAPDSTTPSHEGLSGKISRTAWVLQWIKWCDTHFSQCCPPICEEDDVQRTLNDVMTKLFASEQGLLHELKTTATTRSSILKKTEPVAGKSVAFDFDSLSPEDLPFVLGAVLVYRTRQKIRDVTQFTVSVGISKNKFFAKRLSSQYKPDAQTILFNRDVIEMLKRIPLTDANNLRGKMGHLTAALLPDVKFLYDIPEKYTFDQLCTKFGSVSVENGYVRWLYGLATGVIKDPVRCVTDVKSMISCKTFPNMYSMDALSTWVTLICVDLSERLVDEYHQRCRVPKDFVIHQTGGEPLASRTRSIPSFVCSYKDVNAVKTMLIHRMAATLSTRFTSNQLFPCNRLGLCAHLTNVDQLPQGQLCLSHFNVIAKSMPPLRRGTKTIEYLHSSELSLTRIPKYLSKKCYKRKRRRTAILTCCRYPSVTLPYGLHGERKTGNALGRNFTRC